MIRWPSEKSYPLKNTMNVSREPWRITYATTRSAVRVDDIRPKNLWTHVQMMHLRYVQAFDIRTKIFPKVIAQRTLHRGSKLKLA